LRKPCHLDREVAFAAAEVGDLERGEEMTEGARPAGPAPARHDLPPLGRGAVLVEVLLAHAPHFLEPRGVGAPFRGRAGGGELRAQQRPHRAEPVGAGAERLREAGEREPAVAPALTPARVITTARATPASP